MRRQIAGAAAATLIVLALLEGLLRLAYVVRNNAVSRMPLPYVFGQIYGPVPPWIDGLRLLEPDETLLWKGRPNVRRTYVDVFSPVHDDAERLSLLRRFWPTMPASLASNPVWEVALDKRGFRQDPFTPSKPASTLRIACLGDSWTFGANVGPTETYPRRLKSLLTRDVPTRRFEVLNLGVLGYSSYQGVALLKSQVVDWSPDVLLVGFGMNDASVRRDSDKRVAANMRDQAPPTLKERFWALLEYVELYRLERYLADVSKFTPPSIGDHLKEVVSDDPDSAYLRPGAAGLVDYDKLEGHTRVSLPDYERHVREIVEIAKRQHITVVLLNNELSPNSPYRESLEDIADDQGVPFVDSGAIVAAARRRMEANLEERLDLRPPPPRGDPTAGGVSTVFRVYREGKPTGRPMYIAGANSALGSLAPNTVAMYDDGTHGDQRAGDGVWSLAVTLPVGEPVFYVYTNGGTPGRWDDVDVPQIRGFRVEAPDGSAEVYRPIDSWGKIYMQADAWHTNAQGYALIAKAVFKRLKDDAHFQAP